MAGKWSIYNDDLSGIEMVDEDNLASPTAPVVSVSPAVGGVATETTKITSPQTGESVETIKRTPLLDSRPGWERFITPLPYQGSSIQQLPQQFRNELGRLVQNGMDVTGVKLPLQSIMAADQDSVMWGYEPTAISDKAKAMRDAGTLDVNTYTSPIEKGWLNQLLSYVFKNDQEIIDSNKAALAEQQRLEDQVNTTLKVYNQQQMDKIRRENGYIYGDRYDTSKPENRKILEEKYRQYREKNNK